MTKCLRRSLDSKNVVSNFIFILRCKIDQLKSHKWQNVNFLQADNHVPIIFFVPKWKLFKNFTGNFRQIKVVDRNFSASISVTSHNLFVFPLAQKLLHKINNISRGESPNKHYGCRRLLFICVVNFDAFGNDYECTVRVVWTKTRVILKSIYFHFAITFEVKTEYGSSS